MAVPFWTWPGQLCGQQRHRRERWPAVGSASLSYDSANRQAGATTTYLSDPSRSTPAVLADSTFKYVYGLGLVYAVTSGGSLGVYHTDGLGLRLSIRNGPL